MACQPRPTTPFARLVQRLSEPGGYFDTDNLISNEASYLHVLGGLGASRVGGGAYLGVGPDQNFSYIAAIRPQVAYLIDIRRDNMLQHLLFKALFALARDRGEYLGLLLGRPAPARGSAQLGLEELVRHFDTTAPLPDEAATTRARVARTIGGFGVPLTREDYGTIDRFHRAFIAAGLGLRFQSFGRGLRADYPTYRQLLLERDLEGRPGSYLVSEDAWNVVRALSNRDCIVPVVGDLAGPTALQAIGRDIAERGLRVSAFYTSNVEFYLMGDGTFGRFLANLRTLPIDGRSVVIRSYFGRGFRGQHPDAVPGYLSTQLLQPIAYLLEATARGEVVSYGDLVTKGLLPLR